MAKKQNKNERKFFFKIDPQDLILAAHVAHNFIKHYGDIEPFKKVVMDRKFLVGNTRRGNIVITYK